MIVIAKKIISIFLLLFIIIIFSFLIIGNKDIKIANRVSLDNISSYKGKEIYNFLEKNNKSENNFLVKEKPTKEVETQKEEKPEVTYQEYNVPNIDSNFKAYMDYRMITDKTSAQWKIQQKAYTDNSTGIRKVENYYLVALGTYYTKKCGDKFIIELENNKEIYVMIGDIKADIHTNSTNQYSQSNNILEFIVDTPKLPKIAKTMGDISYCGFEGKIISITKIKE